MKKSSLFRQNNFNLNTKHDFEIRQLYISRELKSLNYLSQPVKKDEPVNPLGDANTTDALFAMFKSNLTNYIPQTLIMWWINYFFAGFIIMKLPFPLTLQFKSMLQNGVNSQDLNVQWVSSISWYFVNLIGLKSILNLILGYGELLDDPLQQQPMMPNLQMEKIMQSELENVLLVPFKSSLENVEARILDMYL